MDEGGELQGSAAEAIGCLQRQRVLADRELENGEVAEAESSAMKGRAPAVVGDGRRRLFLESSLAFVIITWKRSSGAELRQALMMALMPYWPWRKIRSTASPSARDWIWVTAADNSCPA